MNTTFATLLACALVTFSLAVGGHGAAAASEQIDASVSLRETVKRSAIFDLKDGSDLLIKGSLRSQNPTEVQIRVTTSLGKTYQAKVNAKSSLFICRYPSDFVKAPKLEPCALYVDATTGKDFDVSHADHQQAEASVLVMDSRNKLIPDIPACFTTDLLDSKNRTDSKSSKWSFVHPLVNLYMRSRAAKLVGVGRSDFDLVKPEDLAFFKRNLYLYDFDFRDRDWSKPLANRTSRTFWQSVWDTWFNSSNDHPWDGNKENTTQSNYVPYAFSNDYSDTLITYWMRLKGVKSLDDNLQQMCIEGTQNLIAMQHKDASNFALPTADGRRENYTAGAFRYGMFENGEFMTEGKGWFYNPTFKDYIDGGVLNGRCVWALGEALSADPKGPLADQLKSAITLSIKFCLNDALVSGYTKKTEKGNIYWRDAGEHAYLLLGMLAACSVAPDMIVLRPEGKDALTLRDACVSSLNALVDLEQPHHQWSVYPNVDSVAIIALAEGAMLFKNHPDAPKWQTTATNVADAWMTVKVDPKEFPGKVVHFGLRITPETMTYNWTRLSPDAFGNRNFIFFYQSGHWIHALSRLYSLTGKASYRARAEAMVSYFCGDNPWGVRLLNEMGGVYNWVEDKDGDGIEDHLKQDMYPESTDFCQIGIFHLMRALAGS